MIVERRLRASIEAQLGVTPAVVLLGPRQVGKTTLAREIAEKRKAGAIYLDLERPADRRRLDDADAYLRAQAGKLVLSSTRSTGPRSCSARFAESSMNGAGQEIGLATSCYWGLRPLT